MDYSQFDRLDRSINEFEQSISKVRTRLAQQPTAHSEKLIERLDSYQGICNVQRRFGMRLRHHFHKGEYEEVARHVKLINALSAMIMDDVHVIVSALEEGQIVADPLKESFDS